MGMHDIIAEIYSIKLKFCRSVVEYYLVTRTYLFGIFLSPVLHHIVYNAYLTSANQLSQDPIHDMKITA